MVVRLLTSTGYFNSRPHEEVDRSRQGVLSTGLYFNSRPHEEVDRLLQPTDHIVTLFQLTTSRGGRPFLTGTDMFRNYFNSRPHEEVDFKPLRLANVIFPFQLTTSRGGRRR